MTRKSLASQTLPTKINTKMNLSPTKKLINTTKKTKDNTIGTQTIGMEVPESPFEEVITTIRIEFQDDQGMIIMVTLKIKNQTTPAKNLKKTKMNHSFEDVEDKLVREIEIELLIRNRETIMTLAKSTTQA
jgi:hypothetical protein